MRILHTSDWHVGRTLHGVSLAAAHEEYFDHLVDLVEREKLDAVLVSGDVYDRAIPSVESIQLLSDALARLASRTRVILTPGNHDSATRLGFSSGFLREELTIRADVTRVGEPIILDDGDGAVCVYALPYLDPDLARARFGDEEIERSHAGVLSHAMALVEADLAARREAAGSRIPAIVMAHAFVTGSDPSDSERDIRVGGVGDVPAALFGREIDYLAIGHLHGPQKVSGPVLARYSGSPVAFSFSEKDHKKSSVVVNVEGTGVVGTELIPAPVHRPIFDITGTLDELLSGAHDHAVDGWVKANVTDDHRPEFMREKLLDRFPHAIVTLHTPSTPLSQLTGVAVTAASDPHEVLRDFVFQVRGDPPTPEEATALFIAYENARKVSA